MEQRVEYYFCYGCNNIITQEDMVKHSSHCCVFDKCNKTGKIINEKLCFCIN